MFLDVEKFHPSFSTFQFHTLFNINYPMKENRINRDSTKGNAHITLANTTLQ